MVKLMMITEEWIDSKLGAFKFTHYMIERLGTAKYSRVHEILSTKPFRAVMTTNYDRLTEIHWEKQGKG